MVSPIKSWILHQHAGSQDPPPSPRPIFHKLAPVWGVCGFGVIPNPNAWLFQQVQWWTMTVFADADCKFLQLVWQKDNHLLKDLLFVVIIVTDRYGIESLLGHHFFVTMVGNTATRGIVPQLLSTWQQQHQWWELEQVHDILGYNKSLALGQCYAFVDDTL